MKKITEYKELSPLIMRYYKRGVLTNNFLSKEDYLSEISEGRLFYESSDMFLCLYVLRDDFYQLYFYALSDEVVLPVADRDLVCDCVGHEDFLCKNGFTKLMTRTKLECSDTGKIFLNETLVAEHKDANCVFKLMSDVFNPITGYVPTHTKIQNECLNGLIYKVVCDNKVVAVLRLAVSAKSVQIKHLCVDNLFQGRGFGKKLCVAALSHGKNCSVWTGEENLSALNLYKSFGFKESGLKSAVYRKEV